MADINGHGSRGKAVFAVTTATFVTATIFVALRITSRFVVLKKRAADDWCMIAAWLLAFGLSFSILFGTSKGLGRHDADIPDAWQPALRQSEYAFTILYNPALMATKTSILIFYLRMSKDTQSVLRIASCVTLTIVTLAGIALTLLNAFQCRPVSAAYDPKYDGKCLSIVTIFLCSAPVNIITDLAILVLPIPVLTGMRLPPKQKAVLVGTFALGIFVTIIDVLRIYYLQQAVDFQIGVFSQLGAGPDFAWNASAAFMWSAVEVNVGIICACIPTLKPLIKYLLPSMITDRTTGVSTAAPVKSTSSSSQAPRSNTPLHRQERIAESLRGTNTRHEMEREIDIMDFLTTTDGTGTMDQPYTRTNPEHHMDIDFLTAPESLRTHVSGLPSSSEGQSFDTNFFNNTSTVNTSTVPSVKRIVSDDSEVTANTIYFGFVNMKRPKSMLKTKGMESFKYCALVTTLFFLLGFSYGLLNSLNKKISKVAKNSTSQNLGLNCTYFAAFFFGALTVGQWTLRKAGFKATFITGLCIYGTGTLIFWPCAVLVSFPGFIISNFVVGFGLSILQTAAYPFVALCGPPDRAEFRLLLAHGVQATASVLSRLLAEKVLLAKVASLIDVQWTYLAVALFAVFLALFFYYMPLPEVTDSELQQQAEDLGTFPDQKVSSMVNMPLIYTTLALAVFAQWTYVAAQESMSVWFRKLLTSVSGDGEEVLTLTVSNYIIMSHMMFAIGRFLTAPLCLYIPPRIILLFIFIGLALLSVLMMALVIDANSIAGMALPFFFFEGPVFPLVFALGLRGLGKKTKMAAGCIAAGASGGAIFPFVMFAVMQVDGKGVRYSYCVIVTLFAFGLLFPLYLNFLRGPRRQVDPVGMRRNRSELPMEERVGRVRAGGQLGG